MHIIKTFNSSSFIPPAPWPTPKPCRVDMASCHEALHEAGDLTPRRLDKLIGEREDVGTSQSGCAEENESQSEQVAEKAIWWHGWIRFW